MFFNYWAHMLWSPRSTREATAQHNWSVGLLTAARESPCGTEEPMQPQIKINTYIFKLLVQSSSSPSLICHLQGTLQRALRNFLKLVLSPSHFQSSVKLVFQNESFKKKKKIPDGFPCYSSNFPGRWEKHTDIRTAASVTNKSQRSPCHEILSKRPHSVLNLPSRFFVCLFFSHSRRVSKWFHTFCLAAKSKTVTSLRAASVGSKNTMGSFSC